MSNNQSPIYIEENYYIEENPHPLDLSDVNWQFFLITLFSVLLITSLIAFIIQFKYATDSALYHRTYYTSIGDVFHYVYESVDEHTKHYLNELTATECIYKVFNDNNIHQTIVDIILKDYCGFYNPPTLNYITERKEQIRHKRRDIHCFIGCKLLLVHILEIILISSLLCATYCGVIFIIQNQDHLNKYSTFVRCECVDRYSSNSALCRVEDDPWASDHVDAAYYSFYDDVWLPFITQYEPSLMNHFQSNNSLYLTSSNKKTWWCPGGDYRWRQYYKEGWLDLDVNGFSESDFLSNNNGRMCGCFDDNGKGCCGCNDKACCSCCVGWVVFAVLCLIVCILLTIIILAHINYPIQHSTVQNFIIAGTEYLMKDIQRVIKDIEDTERLWAH